MAMPTAVGVSPETPLMQQDPDEAYPALTMDYVQDGDAGVFVDSYDGAGGRRAVQGEGRGGGGGAAAAIDPSGEAGGGGGGSGGTGGGVRSGSVKKDVHPRFSDTPRRSRKSNRSSGGSTHSGQQQQQQPQGGGRSGGSQKRQNSGRSGGSKSGRAGSTHNKPGGKTASSSSSTSPSAGPYKDPSSHGLLSRLFDTVLARTGHVGPDGRATFEAKALLTATVGTLVGLLLQVVAVSTNSWLLLDLPGEGLYRNASQSYLVGAYTGLWKLCRVEAQRHWSQDGTKLPDTQRIECESHNLFPTEAEIQRNKDYDQHHLDYTRTAIAFTIIAFVMTAIGHSFAFYALRRPRYIIKRLAALLHFMTAACLLVLNEVFVKMVDHEKANMPERIPQQAVPRYGYSFILSWIVFVVFVLAGMVFLLLSHKRKPEYADHEEGLEDEPMQLGRR